MFRMGLVLVSLLVFAAPRAFGQVQKVQVRGWDPVVVHLSGEEANTVTISGRLMAHEAAHVVQQRRGAPAPAAPQAAKSFNSSRSNVARVYADGTGTLDLEIAEDVAPVRREGDPVPGIDVSLEQIPGGGLVTTATDGEGRFAFEHLTPGDYELRWVVGGTEYAQQVKIVSDVSIKEEGVN